MIRDAIFTCAQILTQISLIYRTEPKTKKRRKEKLKSKKGYAHKYRLTVREIRGRPHVALTTTN